MVSVEEISTWSNEETLAQIRKSLPPGWSFSHDISFGWHYATATDGAGVTQWSGEHLDERVLYLDAFGWLSYREYQPRNPIWRPRSGELRVPGGVPSRETVDPGDLDPAEVRAVYGGHRGD